MPDSLLEAEAPVQAADAATGEPVVEAEVQADGSVEATVEVEAPVEPAADDASVKLAAVEAELESVRAAYLACETEKAVLTGQLSEAQAKLAAAEGALAPLQAELALMGEKLSGYELGAALANERLPAQAGPMVATIYKNALVGARSPQPIGAWLAAYLASAEGAPLAMLRGAPAADPSASVSPVHGAANSGLTPLPSFLRSTR